MLTRALANTASPKITAGVSGGVRTPKHFSPSELQSPGWGGAVSLGQGKGLSTQGMWRNGGPELLLRLDQTLFKVLEVWRNMGTPHFPSPGPAVQRKWVWGLNLTDGVEPLKSSRDPRMCSRHLHSSSYINHFQGVLLVFPAAARSRTSAVGQGGSPDPHLHLSPSFLPPLVRPGTGVVPCFALPRDKCPNPWICLLRLPLIPLHQSLHIPQQGWDHLWDHPNPGPIFHQLLSQKRLLSPSGNWPAKSWGSQPRRAVWRL